MEGSWKGEQRICTEGSPPEPTLTLRTASGPQSHALRGKDDHFPEPRKCGMVFSQLVKLSKFLLMCLNIQRFLFELVQSEHLVFPDSWWSCKCNHNTVVHSIVIIITSNCMEEGTLPWEMPTNQLRRPLMQDQFSPMSLECAVCPTHLISQRENCVIPFSCC